MLMRCVCVNEVCVCVNEVCVCVCVFLQVKTGGSVPLRKARYRALTRVCAVLEVLDGMAPVRTLPLPLSNETHAAVQGINRAMGELSAARCQLVALLMGLSGRDSCANLARALTELQLELEVPAQMEERERARES